MSSMSGPCFVRFAFILNFVCFYVRIAGARVIATSTYDSCASSPNAAVQQQNARRIGGTHTNGDHHHGHTAWDAVVLR
jgi:hypothetical protein